MSIFAFIFILGLTLFLLGIIAFGIYHFAREIAQGIGWYGIPYINTPERKIQFLLDFLELKDGEVFIDIGCWDGTILEAVKIKFPRAKVIWYERSNRPYKDALLRKEKNGLDYEIYNEDFLKSNIENATVLYSYMIHYMMKPIWKKIVQDCLPGTIFLSSSFPVPNVGSKKILKLPQNGWDIFIYEVPAKEKWWR